MSFWLSTRGERVPFPFLESTSKYLCVNRTKGSFHALLMEFMHGYLDYSQHPIPLFTPLASRLRSTRLCARQSLTNEPQAK